MSTTLLGETIQAINQAGLIDMKKKKDEFGEALLLQDTERGALWIRVLERGELVNLVPVQPDDALETLEHAHAMEPLGEVAIRLALIDITSQPPLVKTPELTA